MHKSKVSAFLSEQIDPRLQQHLFAPLIKRETAASFADLVRLNKAHLVMLCERAILEPETCRMLAHGIRQIEVAGPDALPQDAAREDAFFNYEARLVEVTGADVGGRLHTGRSRNDLKAAQDRLRARAFALDILDGTLAVRHTLAERAGEFADVVMPGYTHLQPAQPTTFGWYLLGILKALERDYERIESCYQRINVNTLGAGALAGTSYPIDRERTRQLLGFDGIVEHTLDAVASRDYLTELLAATTGLATTWSRLAQDFYLMTSYEFQTLELPDRVAGTSSMMPQKKNMVVLEDLKAGGAQLLGAYTTAISTVRGTQFTNTVDANREAFRWCWEALSKTVDSLHVLDVVIEGARPRPERMRQLVEGNFSAATDLADAMVQDAGLPFRLAHHVTGAVIRAAAAAGMRSNEITSALVAEVSEKEFGQRIEIAPELLASVLDPARGAERRRGTGGPAQADISGMRSASLARVQADQAAQLGRRARIAAADVALDAAFDHLHTSAGSR
ncbi:MAG: argininosuccinate lyase [Hyphomicrobiaceae bacterium]